MEKAMNSAMIEARMAEIVARKNEIVLFSPASASFDFFKNFEERGQKFKELVNRL